MAYQLDDERTDYAELVAMRKRVRRLELNLEELWARCDVRLSRLEELDARVATLEAMLGVVNGNVVELELRAGMRGE